MILTRFLKKNPYLVKMPAVIMIINIKTVIIIIITMVSNKVKIALTLIIQAMLKMADLIK